MHKIICIIGARPQFIKHAPIELAARNKLDLITIHTGQHYDQNMSKIFFEELNLTRPKYQLSIGSHTHGKQTGLMLIKIEEILLNEVPDAVLVYGDTNSTLAGALAASKLQIPIIHVEAGLRSFNKGMPEEINRILTDHLSALLFAPTDQGVNNLKLEGLTRNVFFTGDIMKDMLMVGQEIIKNRKVENLDDYYYATIHRPYNTDDVVRLKAIFNVLNELPKKVILATHPRTFKKMEHWNILPSYFPNISFIPPVSYFKNIQYQSNASAILTDSGGMQKEAYILKKKCITIRSETEWTDTLEGDWNELVFDDLDTIPKRLKNIPFSYNAELYGNGKASEEIIELITDFINKRE